MRDESRLHVLVLRAHEERAKAALALREQRFGVFLAGARNHVVGDVEDSLDRAVVLFELDDFRAGKNRGEIHDVAEVGPAERIDRLRVVADRHHVAMIHREQPHQVGLDQVGVLVLVDHDVAIAVRHAAPHVLVLFEQLRQPIQQVVVVEQPALALVALVIFRELENFRLMLAEMRKIDLDFFFERAPLVARHADRFGDRALLREAALARRRVPSASAAD